MSPQETLNWGLQSPSGHSLQVKTQGKGLVRSRQQDLAKRSRRLKKTGQGEGGSPLPADTGQPLTEGGGHATSDQPDSPYEASRDIFARNVFQVRSSEDIKHGVPCGSKIPSSHQDHNSRHVPFPQAFSPT